LKGLEKRGTHIGDDCVAIMSSDKVLDGTWGGVLQLVPSDEMVGQLVLRRVGGAAIHGWDSAVCAHNTIAIDCSHCAGINARVGTSVSGRVTSGGLGVLERDTQKVYVWKVVDGLSAYFPIQSVPGNWVWVDSS
jgi:hypothetical protein